MPKVKLDRLVTGVSWFDDWIDRTLSAIERALNVTSSGSIATNVRPDGISLTFTGSYFRVAKSGGSGIGAGTSADVTLYDYDGSTLTSQTVTVKAYNMGSSAVNPNKMLILCQIGIYWFVIWEDCG